MGFFRGFIALGLSVSLFLTSFGVVLSASAKQEEATPSVDTVAQVNSFELFWPLVAGKTIGESLYSVKRLKETIRGWFIFAPASKAEYAVFLATKRVLEAEKLIGQDKKNDVEKTLDLAQEGLSAAEKQVDKVISKGEKLGSSGPSMTNRLNNIEKLAAWLSSQNEEHHGQLQKLVDKSKSLRDKL